MKLSRRGFFGLGIGAGLAALFGRVKSNRFTMGSAYTEVLNGTAEIDIYDHVEILHMNPFRWEVHVTNPNYSTKRIEQWMQAQWAHPERSVWRDRDHI